ncbi:uncharacterized protein LOC111698435 isoform X2 [Eurytemora carolleeae]|uniref:uncharacterized protein LOC111698435 isoform X2 n=1 Tax=Eurytemora carolleeae TaxID=1294199 RepID=UPI000C77BDC5|nr:uncharacterized protein LOC111698435 isoform X2 [Eurytemora carolleeae]|eukprot:XP_023324546.1 uncharacterized protein LOC111698435 isoform X2 [Eurytemora affinis]
MLKKQPMFSLALIGTFFVGIGFILSYRNQVYSFHKEVLKSYGSWNALQNKVTFFWPKPRRRPLGGRFDTILDFCGELCDLTKEIQKNHDDVMGTVTAKVDCAAIFASDEIDKPSGHAAMQWEMIPEHIQNEFTHHGKISVNSWFIDETFQGGTKTVGVYSKEEIQKYIDSFLAGTPLDNYSSGSTLINQGLEQIDVKNKSILIIGTQNPWVEAVVLSKDPSLVMTLEYGMFKSEFPKLEFVTPAVFRERYKKQELPLFDVIISYSSLEHSGLGRYGDAINPWGDILTIARVSCVSSPDAKLVIGVPVAGVDRIEFNAARVYGPILYPYLVTNWKLFWTSAGNFTPAPDQDVNYQPVYIFEKNHQ